MVTLTIINHFLAMWSEVISVGSRDFVVFCVLLSKYKGVDLKQCYGIRPNHLVSSELSIQMQASYWV